MEFFVSYPLHELHSGPIEHTEEEVEVCSLNGVYLDYGLAIAVDAGQVGSLDFLPGGRPWRIRIGNDHSNLSMWSPTQNIELAQRLISSQLSDVVAAEAGNFLEPLRSIVISKLGNRINIPVRKNA
ncbi:hypothetical protein KRX52_13210 [Pseudomonas sp. MAP12]|uniref:Uncharacterized protein n=1 Tax=Geopseudomonas aromaticivorans TaxID=2849492 RepID=A0ABS6MZG1_9GAMM|nr:hypothetical protein [Pseudomonas aromaticivorans]MBV2133736.1 hypothetical protein [Pseudomonas aromaticivorans]